MSVSTSATIDASQIRRIALMPSGGVLADAIGIELLNFGFDIVDTATVTSILARYNLNEFEIGQPQNIKLLADQGIDSLLITKSVAGYDGRPESASVRLISTATGSLLIGSTWQNGRGGAQGSPADGMMRSNLSEAATEIAAGIGENLRRVR
jgi:hypothetical protein